MKQWRLVFITLISAFFLVGFRTEASTLEMYRLYNPNTSEHFYTLAVEERNHLISVGWQYEGIGWVAPEQGHDVYRLFNPNAKGGDHHYTLSAEERDFLVKAGWKYEGVAWKSSGPIGLHRLYNPNASSGSHHYTTSAEEANHLASIGWKYEGIAWQAVAEGYLDTSYGKPTTQEQPKETGVTVEQPALTHQPTSEQPAPTNQPSYKNCDAVRAAGAAPIRKGDPGYGPHLDRDGDGIGCELTNRN